MRGKAAGTAVAIVEAGITPAYAGKRHKEKGRFYMNKDHPRLCGEKLTAAAFAHCFQGSPPPMRGKAFQTSSSVPPVRITPAYAGKRLMPACVLLGAKDHPRLCGEKSPFGSRRPHS